MSDENTQDNIAQITDAIRDATADAETAVLRSELTRFTSDIFNTIGLEL